MSASNKGGIPMAVKLQPLSDWVVAEQEDAVTKTASGLYLPDKAAEKSSVAKVLKVGEKVKKVKVGDRIVFKGYSSTDKTIDGRDYIFVEEKEIIATVKDERPEDFKPKARVTAK
jgi:chaperonin GroES